MIVERCDAFFIDHDWAPNIIATVDLDYYFDGLAEYDLILRASTPAYAVGWLQPRYGQKRLFGDTTSGNMDSLSTFALTFSSRRVCR